MSVKILTPEVKLIKQGSGLQGIFEQIEIAGRNCYASSHNIQYKYIYNEKIYKANDLICLQYNKSINTGDYDPISMDCEYTDTIENIYNQGNVCNITRKSITAEDFVKRMIKSEHYAMLEHGTVYLVIPIEEYEKNYKNKYFTQE